MAGWVHPSQSPGLVWPHIDPTSVFWESTLYQSLSCVYVKRAGSERNAGMVNR